MYFKIFNEEECHYDFQYKTGLNVDKKPFISDASEDCAPGGLYFSDEKSILKFLDYGPFIREVQIPKDAQVVHFKEKSRADKLELLERRDLRKASTWEWLIENEVNIRIDEDLPLRQAALYGHTESVKILLKNGADPNAHDGEPLINAALYGHTESVKILLKYGADPNASNGKPLRNAAWRGYTKIAKILLKYGADINVCNGEPLINAAYYGYTKIAKILLKYGADINVSNGEPLRTAAWKGHTEIAKILLKYGADPNAEDYHGETALDYAKRNNHTQIVKILEEARR